MYWLGLTLCTNGSLVFFVKIFFWHWCCGLFGFDAVYWWEPLFLFETSSFGTDAVYWLGLTLCTGGGLCFFSPRSALMLCTSWHWCCVLVGLDGVPVGTCVVLFNSLFWRWCWVLVGFEAVYWWGPFFKHPLLALMLCTGWAGRSVLTGALFFV